MLYRLIENESVYGKYGRLLTEKEYEELPYDEKASCEPVSSFDSFDFTVQHYVNGQPLAEKMYGFFINEVGELHEAKNPSASKLIFTQETCKVHEVYDIKDIDLKSLKGYHIVVIKN